MHLAQTDSRILRPLSCNPQVNGKQGNRETQRVYTWSKHPLYMKWRYCVWWTVRGPKFTSLNVPEQKQHSCTDDKGFECAFTREGRLSHSDKKVLSFGNRIHSKHVTQVHYTLNASYISDIFHFSPSASSQWLSVALEQHELSAHPASWHFCLSHFCPGCSTGGLESQAFASQSWPLTKTVLTTTQAGKQRLKLIQRLSAALSAGRHELWSTCIHMRPVCVYILI